MVVKCFVWRWKGAKSKFDQNDQSFAVRLEEGTLSSIVPFSQNYSYASQHVWSDVLFMPLQTRKMARRF